MNDHLVLKYRFTDSNGKKVYTVHEQYSSNDRFLSIAEIRFAEGDFIAKIEWDKAKITNKESHVQSGGTG
jgi:hypothetical protein